MLVVNLLLRDISYFKRDCFILTESLYGTEGPNVEEFGPRFANVDITRSSVIRDLSPSEVEQLSEHLNIKIKTETSRFLSSIETNSLFINYGSNWAADNSWSLINVHLKLTLPSLADVPYRASYLRHAFLHHERHGRYPTKSVVGQCRPNKNYSIDYHFADEQNLPWALMNTPIAASRPIHVVQDRHAGEKGTHWEKEIAILSCRCFLCSSAWRLTCCKGPIVTTTITGENTWQ